MPGEIIKSRNIKLVFLFDSYAIQESRGYSLANNYMKVSDTESILCLRRGFNCCCC